MTIIDKTAQARAAVLLPENPDATVAQVYQRAAREGLAWLAEPGRCPAAADFAPRAALDGHRVEVELLPEDAQHAARLAAALGVAGEHVVGAAVRTGLAVLTAGPPFRIGVTPLGGAGFLGPLGLDGESLPGVAALAASAGAAA